MRSALSENEPAAVFTWANETKDDEQIIDSHIVDYIRAAAPWQQVARYHIVSLSPQKISYSKNSLH